MSESNSPWLAAASRTSPAVDETQPTPSRDANPASRTSRHGADAAAQEPPALPAVTGAAAPQPAVAPVAPGEGLRVSVVRPTASVWVVGSHGGAGETTLADLVDEWEATGHTWPTPSDLSFNCPVLLVARADKRGLDAAREALRQWASGVLGDHVNLLGLVLVADAPGRLPKPLRHLVEVVSGGAPRLWEVPWVEAWRTGEPLERSALPKALRQLIADASLLSGHGPE
jgi:hypothetical protein